MKITALAFGILSSVTLFLLGAKCAVDYDPLQLRADIDGLTEREIIAREFVALEFLQGRGSGPSTARTSTITVSVHGTGKTAVLLSPTELSFPGPVLAKDVLEHKTVIDAMKKDGSHERFGVSVLIPGQQWTYNACAAEQTLSSCGYDAAQGTEVLVHPASRPPTSNA